MNNIESIWFFNHLEPLDRPHFHEFYVQKSEWNILPLQP